MREVYAVAAQRCGKSLGSVVRQLLRLCNHCWDLVWKDEEQMKRLVGSHRRDIDSPSEVIFLLACFLEYKKSFEEVLDQEPELIF